MKHLVITLLLATLCAVTGHGQTIKSLGYNASNNVVVFSPTNTNQLTFTNAVSWSFASATNNISHIASFASGVGFYYQGNVVWRVDTNGLQFANQNQVRNNLGIGTNDAVDFGELEATNLLGGAVLLRANSGGRIEPALVTSLIFGTKYFIGADGNTVTNWTANVTRTNLGLPLPALTNDSNVTMMRALSGSTNTNEPYSGSVSLTNTNTLVFSNGILLRTQ